MTVMLNLAEAFKNDNVHNKSQADDINCKTLPVAQAHKLVCLVSVVRLVINSVHHKFLMINSSLNHIKHCVYRSVRLQLFLTTLLG